ncbi:MAG: MFS transporter, partial [Geminicoccaceae bacterium]|nr:MFS transporter [Geminicoccaceae bacterium]
LVVTDIVLLGLALTGRLALWQLLIAAVMGGIAWTIETPVRRTMLADAVGLERVSAAMGLEVVGVQLTRIMGPAIGGILLDMGGIASVFAMGIVVHGLCTWMMLSQPPDRPTTAPANLAGLARNLAEGFTYVRRHRLLTGAVMLTVVFNFFGFPYVALAPVIGERVL